MKIRILTSCTGEKQYTPDNQLTQADFRLLVDPGRFNARETELNIFRVPAEMLYTGLQHVRLMEGVSAFRKRYGVDSVDVWILSAGYGLILGTQAIVPYECTFQGMKVAEIDTWATYLGIPACARQFFAQPADLVVVLLGNAYLRALALDESVIFAAPTLFFIGNVAQRRISGQGEVRSIVLSPSDTQRFSCGMVGLKGEVGRRLLKKLSKDSESLFSLLDPKKDVLRWLLED